MQDNGHEYFADGVNKKWTPRYYENLGMAHDCLMRCKDCQKLVPYSAITKIGCCDGCGNKRFTEITLLTEVEMEAVKTMDFPYKEQFIKEFAGVEL